MAREHSQATLEKMVNDDEMPANVVFFEKAAIDQNKSVLEKRRCYKKHTYMKKTVPGLSDWVAHVATREDIRDYPDQYQTFLANKQGKREAGIEIIPGLDIIALQELTDYGLTTINKLAVAVNVPAHLQYAQDAAVRIRDLLQEERSHGKATEENAVRVIVEEGSNQTLTTKETGIPGGRGNDSHADSSRSQSEGIQDDSNPIRRETGEGLQADRCLNGGESVSWDNWSVEIRH